MDLKYNTDASLLFGPLIWNGDGYSLITNAFSLCCNTTSVDLFNDTTKLDITIQSGGTNDVVFVAAGYASIQLVASQLDAVGHYRLAYAYPSLLPSYELFDVVQPEAWDAKYGTLASNIVNIKAGTTSIAINVASTLAQISVFSASTIRDLTSIAINVNSLVISTASVLRDTASVAARLVLFNASTAIGIASLIVGVQSTIAKIDVMSPSITVGITSILAQVSAFSASTMRDLTSIAIGVNSISIRMVEFGSSASLASSIWGHLTATSTIVAIKSTLSNTLAILAASGTSAESIASAVWGHTTSLSMIVAVKSTLSNTLAILDASGASADSIASAVWGHTTATSTIVSIKSALSNTIAINVGVLSSAIAIKSAWSNTIALGVSTASLLVATTSIAIGVNSIAVRTLEFGSSASLASAIWGHTTSTSMLVAVHSTLSNTIAINTGVLSVASSVWDVVRASHVTAGTFGEVGSVDSMASAVWGHNIATSTIVAIKSTLSNTIAINVSTSSLLVATTSIAITASSILNNVILFGTSTGVSTASLLVAVQSILNATTSIAISTSSLLVNLAALNNISAADVNAQVLDVLNVDTFGEPAQGAPGATITLEQKIAYIYKMLRNKITTTSALINVYNDAGDTVDQKAALTDDGTTFTRGEFGTGA